MEPHRRENAAISLLYVEDDEDTRNLVGSMLTRKFPDLRNFCAENGEAGLKLFREHNPDIVVTDLNMPIMNGVKMAEAIKSLNPETIIIAMTAYHNTLFQLNADEVGIDQYILKPVEYEKAFEVLEECIQRVGLKRKGLLDATPQL